MWVVLIGLLAVGALALLFRAGGGPLIKKERERLQVQQRRALEREAARRVLAGEARPLPKEEGKVGELRLTAGEEAYFAAPASLLRPVADASEVGATTEFERQSRGNVFITDRAFIYQPENGATVRLEADNIGRVDVPLADILEVVTFADTFAREEKISHFQLSQPLLAAAYISRFADFQLVLGDTD